MTTLKLYQTHLTLGRNAKVDNIESYLATLQHTDLNIQYQRLGTDITINVPIEQKYVGEAKWNYASITQDDKIYYFFVIGADWQARKTVALSLSMDTVNTWWDELKWSSKTSIVREHQDRFYKPSTVQFNQAFKRKIDIYNEGLDATLTRQDLDIAAQSNNASLENSNWYLIFKTRDGITPDNTVNPISALLLSDRSMHIKDAINVDTRPIPLSAVVDTNHGVAYITTSGAGDHPNIIITDNIGSTTYTFDQDTDGSTIRAYRLTRDGLRMKVEALYYTGDSYPYAFKKTVVKREYQGLWLNDSRITLTNIAYYHSVAGQNTFYRELTSLASIDGLPQTAMTTGHIPAQDTIAFEDLDRSNSTFMKIIQLPYPPCEINGDYFHSIFPNGWFFNEGYYAMETILGDQQFSSTLKEINLGSLLLQQIVRPNGNELFNYHNESKLYNSQFYNLFMNYGDVSLPIKLEKFGLGNAPYNLTPTFDVSNALTSTMLFKAKYQGISYSSEYLHDDCLFSTVSTEKPIFNSSYVDYLRTGYNYDKEALNQQNRMAAVQGTLSIIGGAVSLGGGIVSARNQIKARQVARNWNPVDVYEYGAEDIDTILNQMPGASGGKISGKQGLQRAQVMDLYNNTVARSMASAQSLETGKLTSNAINVSLATQLLSGGINAFSSAYSTMRSIESNNRSFAAGMTSKQVQSVNALGISDINIQTLAYGNKLKVLSYTPEIAIQQQLARMFHYVGYNHPVQEVPNFTSRYWFNFVQCEPVFKDEEVSVYSNYLDDIKARFAAGITVYHTHNGVIDWEQEKENWEKWLMEA